MTQPQYEKVASHSWETGSADATFALGEALGRSLVGGLTIGLVGPLGAGKTQLVKGMAAGNAIDGPVQVTSPTFTLVHEYPGRFRLYHVDAYRLGKPQEYLELGCDEWAERGTVVVVEWADRVSPLLPSERLWIKLSSIGEMQRRFAFEATGTSAVECLERMKIEG